MKPLVLTAVVAIFAVQPILAADEIVYQVAGERLSCLVRNADRYLKLSDEQLVISLKDCPNIPDDPFSSLTQNIEPDLPDEDNTKFDLLIVLTKEQLNCVSKLSVDDRVKYYEFFPVICKVVPKT